MSFKLLPVSQARIVLACFAVMFSGFFTAAAFAAESSQTDHTRGKLLYSIHCIACHNAQVHWLANKKASDWPSLIAQVKLWQNIANLRWNDQDIENVARYLNTAYYHYPTPNTVAHQK